MKTRILSLVLSLVLFGPLTAQADTLTPFTLSATFTDGGTASGTFTLDSTTNTLLNVSITETAGSALPGFTYSMPSTGLLFFGVTQYYFDVTQGGQPPFCSSCSILRIVFANYPSLDGPTFYAAGYGTETLYNDGLGVGGRDVAFAEIVPTATPLPAHSRSSQPVSARWACLAGAGSEELLLASSYDRLLNMDGKSRGLAIGVIGAVVGTVITGGLSYISQQHDIEARTIRQQNEIDAKMIELSIGILRAGSTAETMPLRKWAVDVIAQRAKPPFDDDQRKALLNQELPFRGSSTFTLGLSPDEIDKLIQERRKDLTSDDPSVRRTARSDLGKIGEYAIPTITEVLAANRNPKIANYRDVLGPVQALAVMDQAVRCEAYKKNPQLKDDVKKHASDVEPALKNAAEKALDCP